MAVDDHVDIILPLEREGKSLQFILKEVQKKCYSVNSSVPIAVIKARLKSLHGIEVSDSQLRELRKKLGYSRTTTKYCQMISEGNKLKRLEFCLNMLEQQELFADCIFTDESTFELNSSSKFCYVRPGCYTARLRSRPKHPAKIHIWGGISMRGATKLAILPGSMRINSGIYCNILENCYLEFSCNTYHGFARLVHDNAPAHKSAYTLKKLDEWGVKTLEWPPESPDLNPVELIWGNMKTSIRLVLLFYMMKIMLV
ncbi:hypothetical protein ANCDUO_19637 [Ancylostoma duodenale]|uniref:Tc1-like transposase DDE domain-containing protein n=1 Tax=Ancylostoma duodenale TaxID=51022 RepID=A0A0C2FNV9_9BILA|nr:hypothetical protein ANCDUO_19637 [Ancylostoma duodenale]